MLQVESQHVIDYERLKPFFQAENDRFAAKFVQFMTKNRVK
jgi:hypothetical protein